jgi:hypothetical protein
MLEFFSAFRENERRPVREAPFASHDDFFRTHLPSCDPVVFRGQAEHWPAAKKWNLDFRGEGTCDGTHRSAGKREQPEALHDLLARDP